MNHIAAYTPLECLLLFQSLVGYGTEPSAFLQISDLLKNNTFVKDGDTYDANRLSVDSLRDLYLHLLAEELRADDEDASDDGGGGAAASGTQQLPNISKKRKLQSPPLPSVKEAQQYREKLPLLVERLYARYRAHMICAIREDERRYAIVQKEIEEIEKDDWASIRAVETKPEAISSPAKSTEETNGKMSEAEEPIVVQNGDKTVTTEETAVVMKETTPAKENVSTLPPKSIQIPPEARHDGLAIGDVLNSAHSTVPPSPYPDATRNGQPIQPAKPPPPPQSQPQPQPQPSKQDGPVTEVPPPQSPHPANLWQWNQQHHQVQYPPSNPFPHTFPHHLLPNAQQAQVYPPRGSYSPRPLPLPHAFVPSSPLNPQQPNLHPPPNSTPQRSPSSPAMPLDALADAAGKQYRASTGSPMIPQQGPQSGLQPGLQQGLQPGTQPSSHAQFLHYQQQRPTANGATPSPQWTQQYLPTYPGTPPQFPYTPNHRPPFPPQPTLIPPENRQYNSPYNPSQGSKTPVPSQQTSTPRSQTAQTQTIRSQTIPPQTPLSQPSQSQFLTGSGTKWAFDASTSTPGPNGASASPGIEPVSPVLNSTAPKTARPLQDVPKPEPRRRGRPARQPPRPRAESAASSMRARSLRSQSFVSQGDELSVDSEIPASRYVKQEVATPRGLEDVGDTTADEGVHRRRRRGTLKDVISPRQSSKRKRQDSAEPEPTPTPTREPVGPRSHVLWTRSFPKISASALEAISGHRNAGTFAHPVKERDAPGYKSLILRPQDLKSIRAAIMAGNRAACAAASEDQHQSSVWLPISEDLIPPKGIINFAQLEKELVRIFANAIMFNGDLNRGLGGRFERRAKAGEQDKGRYEFDEDGVVKETRAMFADVERIMENLRSAERKAVGLTVATERSDAVAMDEDELDDLTGEDDGATRRRKKAA